MSEASILLVILSGIVGFVQVLFLFILNNMNGEIKALRQRVHDLVEITARLDTVIEMHFKKEL